MKRAILIVLTIVIGVILGFFGVLNSVFADGMLAERLLTIAVILLVYALVGFVFGLIAVKGSWYMGLFLSLPGVIFLLLYLLREFNAFYPVYIVLLIGVSCLAACGGGGLRARKKTLLR